MSQLSYIPSLGISPTRKDRLSQEGRLEVNFITRQSLFTGYTTYSFEGPFIFPRNHYSHYEVSSSLLWQSSWNKWLKMRKDLFWLTVWDISAHDCLALLPWACGESECHGREQVVEKCHLPQGCWEAERGRERGVVRVLVCPSRVHSPHDLTSFY